LWQTSIDQPVDLQKLAVFQRSMQSSRTFC
jgi:hypothetical protein